MVPSESFHALMARLCAGDAAAADQVFADYARRLIGLARTRLDRSLRRKLDPEDVLQSVFRSFFGQCVDGHLDLKSRDNLWALLVVITLRKCGRRVEYFHAARRDARLEVDENSRADWEALGREPAPEAAAILTETIEQCMRVLDERGRQILSLSLQGQSVEEISNQVGRTERTVYRVLEQVRARLEELRAED